MCTSTQASAASATGTIAKYRLDIRPQEPSVCIQLDPPLPGEKWACLIDRNTVSVPTPNGPLYIQPCSHLGEVIHDAYLSMKVCTISWEFVDIGGNAIIGVIECKK
jgi:hypothetical protein